MLPASAPLLSRAADGSVLSRVFHHRKDVPVNHFVDTRFRDRSQECTHVDPMQLDQYALGVVIYEYVASAVAGTPVHGDGRGDTAGEFWQSKCGGRERATAVPGWSGWAGCGRWHAIIRQCCSWDVAQRTAPEALLSEVRSTSAELARELEENILWASKPKKGKSK